MPRGYSVRRPEPLQVAVTLVEIQDGADLLESLNDACGDYLPSILFSVLGAVRPAHLRVPRDECIDELVNSPAPFGVEIRPDFDPDGQPGMPNGGLLPDGVRVSPEVAATVSIAPKPHWFDETEFTAADPPLTILYGHGGRASATSIHNYHLILSGYAGRPGGAFETFVGQLRPGSRAHGSCWVVMGAASAWDRGYNVRGLTVSVEIGQDVMEVIARYIGSPRAQGMGRSFVWSATGYLARATLSGADGDEFTLEEHEDGEGYQVEAMTAVFGGDLGTRINVTLMMRVAEGEVKCDSVGGELVSGIVGGIMPLDIFIGETGEPRPWEDWLEKK
jgi:hypothetical protein